MTLGGSAIPFGKYDLLERINIGGMAEIVKARDTGRSGEPIVAVKRILPHLTDDRQFVTMFLDESRVLAQLEHDKIIHAFEIGDVDGAPYIALEYVYGQDARVLFHRSRRNEENVPISLACFVIAEVCDALHYAHERTDADGSVLGLVHRDVSLQNVLISYEGKVKLTDFGIAMSAENRARTEAGIVKGKFGYMSPEQIKGETLDRRSDVFAAGICLYELLTSERLFSGDSDYAAVERVRSVDIQPPSVFNRQIPSALEDIVMKALARHPRDRYQTANDMRRALLTFMTDSHNEASARDLSEHMRVLFADEIRKQPTPGTLLSEAARGADEGTGLAAFDDLDPVSALSALNPDPAAGGGARPDPTANGWRGATATPRRGAALADHRGVAPRGAPSVPPLVPRPESIPGGVQASDLLSPRRVEALAAGVAQGHAPPSIDMEWDDDDDIPTDIGELEEPFGQSAGDDDVTRQIRVGETFSGAVIGGSGIRGVVPFSDGAPAPFPQRPDVTPSQPVPAGTVSPSGAPAGMGPTSVAPIGPETSPAPAATDGHSYALAVAVVAAIIALISGGLYLSKEPEPGVIQLETYPVDAEVRVNGTRVASTRSPFVVPGLAPDTEHAVEVSKDGYAAWQSRLTVRAGQTLQLPLVTLEPLLEVPDTSIEQPTAAAKAPKRSAPARAKPRSAPSKPRASPEPKARTTAKASARSAKKARVRAKPKPRAPADPPAASGFGTLRINSRPWSQVIVDGRTVGNTPQTNVRLSAGKHTVTLVNPQFELRKTIHVRLKAGQTITKVINLM